MSRKNENASSRQPAAGVLSAKGPESGYFSESRGLALSFVLIAPLLLVYEYALIYYPPARERRAGQFLRETLESVFHSRAGIVLNLLVVGLLLIAVIVLARRGRLHFSWVFPMVVESIGWAGALVGLGACFGFLLPAESGNALENVINSIGAGVYEEILFRFFLVGGLFLLGMYLFKKRTVDAVTFSVIISSVIFALCHRSAIFSESHHREALRYFLFFFGSGLLFSGLYLWRGLGLVVYTHVIYDIFVRLADF